MQNKIPKFSRPSEQVFSHNCNA